MKDYGAILEHEQPQVQLRAPAGLGKGCGLAFVPLVGEEREVVFNQSGPDQDITMNKGGRGDARTDFGLWKDLEKVFDYRIVLLAHSGREHFAGLSRVRRLGFVACGINDFGVGGGDVQPLKDGAESGDVIC